MHLRSFLSGILVGAITAVIVMLFFGQRIRGEVAETTREIGTSVEKAGETIKDTGKQMH